MYAKYNTVGQHPHIPRQAFLFIPHRQQTQKQRDDFRIGQKKDIRRLLFEGWAEETYTPYELEKLKQLDDYIARKNLKFDQRWDRSWRLRWLLSTGCKVKKTIEDMHIFTKYQDSVQELTFTSEIEKYLKQGIYYMAGRDSHYRPIFVFDVQKIIKLDMSDELILETQTYFFQYALRNLLIPGQVQNWVTVIDAAETGLMSLIGSMKKSFGFLSDTYRSRMFVCYVCRVPSSLSFIWRVVKGFLEEQTVKKINFFDDQTIEPLMEFCNPEQVQVKFGGTLPNLKQGQFWPPRQVSPNYECSKNSTKLITQAQYNDFYQNKVLYNTKFQQAFLQLKDNSSPLSPQLANGAQYSENKQKQTVLKLQQHFRKQFNNLEQQAYKIPLLYMPRPPNYKHLVRISRESYEKEDTRTK